mgnify:CR=1 FL=1
MDWFDLLNTQDPGSFELTDPRSQDSGYGFDAVNLAPGQGNLEQDYYVTDRGGVNTSYGEVFRPPTTPTNTDWLSKLFGAAKNVGGKAMDFAGTPQGIMTLLAAFAALKDRQKPSGGGTTMGMMAPRQYNRTVDPKGIVRYAAEGGLMHAYAHGGEAQAYAGGKPLMMEDGGFVFTEEATRNATPQGIAALGGKMISAPGNGTDDKGITGIIGKNGVTPARVSKGESYFTEEVVEANGGPKRMYAKMNALQRKA